MRKVFPVLLFLVSTMFAQSSELAALLDEIKELTTLSGRVTQIEDAVSSLPDQPTEFDTTAIDNELGALRLATSLLRQRIESLESRPDPKPVEIPEGNPYEFILKDENGDGFVDEEWESILKKGQALQAKEWAVKEKYWMDELGAAPAGQVGWLGSSAMPLIKIVCTEGEYFFKNTARLPGRFHLQGHGRWSSILRFYGSGSKVIVDDIAYGTATNAPIGIYVEGKTQVSTVNGAMTVKPFEQTIRDVIIVAMDGVMPVYLSQNQDRFLIQNCNIQQHRGAMIGIKHGPPLQVSHYPFDGVTQINDGNTYLADPRFLDLQLEGPHSGVRKQAAIFASGNNMMFNRINLYGWTMGILCHGGQGRTVNAITQHDGLTADGRRFTTKENILTVALSTRPGANADSVTGVAGGFKVWILPKRSPAPATAGWYVKGGGLL